MNETAELADNLPAIILISLWWAFLSTLDILFTPRDSDKSDDAAAKPPDDATATNDEQDAAYAELRELDPAFGAEAFLKGARRAYDAVLHAYALGDFKSLRPLLSDEVLEAFADACAGRRERQETLELTVIGIESAEIVSTEVTSGTMEIAVLFHAQIVSAERAANGDVIGGDPAVVAVTSDLWTFARPVPVDGNAWIVVATDEIVAEPA